MRATLEEIKAIVASYVQANLIGGVFSITRDNLAGLLDKIAKTFQIDGLFNDKLPELDGEELPYGKTVEEYFEDLCAVLAYEDGKVTPSNAVQGALQPYYPEYRPAAYSQSLGRKVIPTTIKFDEYERAFNDGPSYETCVNTITKRLYDTFAMFKYNVKKDICGTAASKANALQNTNSALEFESAAPTLYAANATTSRTGTLVANNRYYLGANWAGKTAVAICVKARASASKTWNEDIAAGLLVPLDLITSISLPVDTTTGEAWLTQVKKDVESAEFVSEGHSLNGNTVGASEGLLLIVLKGVKPVIDVQVEAGAFHPEKLAVPAETKVVDDFGAHAPSGLFAILVDRRGLRLHQAYQAVREQMNGYSDFISYFLHTENTAFISRNTFIKAYIAS